MGFGSSSSQFKGKGQEYRVLTKTVIKERTIKMENSGGKANGVCGEHSALSLLECAEELEPKIPLSSVAGRWVDISESNSIWHLLFN